MWIQLLTRGGRRSTYPWPGNDQDHAAAANDQPLQQPRLRGSSCIRWLPVVWDCRLRIKSMTHPGCVPSNVISVRLGRYSGSVRHPIGCKAYCHGKLIFELLVKSTIDQTTYDCVDHGFASIARRRVILEVPTKFRACPVVPHPEALRNHECDCSRRSICVATFHVINQRVKVWFRKRSNPQCRKRSSHRRSISQHAFNRVTLSITRSPREIIHFRNHDSATRRASIGSPLLSPTRL